MLLTFVTTAPEKPASPDQHSSMENESIKKNKIVGTHKLSSQQNLYPEPKIKKALNFIQQRSRNPSVQTASAPKSLLENDLLKKTRWKLWPQTQVINFENKSASDRVLAQVSNLLIIESQDEGIELTEFNQASPLAVYDSRLKKAGILTGIIKVQTPDKEQLAMNLNQLNAHITDSFDSIHVYFVTGTDPVFNLQHLYENLKSYPYITNVELEILYKNYEKN